MKTYIYSMKTNFKYLKAFLFGMTSLLTISASAQTKVQVAGNSVHITHHHQIATDTINDLRNRLSDAELMACGAYRLGGGQVYFLGVVISEADLRNADMTQEKGVEGFDNLLIDHSDLSQSNWSDNRFMKLMLHGNVNLSGADFSRVDVDNVFMDDVFGADFNFQDSHADSFSCSDFHLPSADFKNARLDGAIFDNSNVSNDWSLFQGLNLYGLPDADFSNAVLRNVQFVEVDLSNANFTGVNFSNVSWSGSYIEGCSGCDCVDQDGDHYCD